MATWAASGWRATDCWCGQRRWRWASTHECGGQPRKPSVGARGILVVSRWGTAKTAALDRAALTVTSDRLGAHRFTMPATSWPIFHAAQSEVMGCLRHSIHLSVPMKGTAESAVPETTAIRQCGASFRKRGKSSAMSCGARAGDGIDTQGGRAWADARAVDAHSRGWHQMG